MGADLAYIGIRFINTRESRALMEHKELIVEAAPTDVIHTPAVTGVPSNFIRKSLVAAGYEMNALLNSGKVNFGEKLTPVDNDSSKAWQDVWSAGHGVAGIDDILPCDSLIRQMIREYCQTRS